MDSSSLLLNLRDNMFTRKDPGTRLRNRTVRPQDFRDGSTGKQRWIPERKKSQSPAPINWRRSSFPATAGTTATELPPLNRQIGT
jgi:hypothetical protein